MQEDNLSQPFSIASYAGSSKIMASCSDAPQKHSGQKNGLRSIEEIPSTYRHIFQYPYFNKMQSLVMDDVLYSDKSVVISAPTGSGKTAIFEIGIVRLLMELEKSNHNGDFKIIYMAPLKALCTERLMDWYGKFIKLGISCIEVTGDSDTLDFSQLRAHKIIMTTPEKWDSLTRRWKDNRQMVEMVKLFIMDEIHLLNEEVRGPVLEAVVSRMKTIQDTLHSSSNPSSIRFIAASATIPNAEDIAEWLNVKYKSCICYKIGEDYRPVKLIKIVEGFPCNESFFKFDMSLSYKLKNVLEKYCDGKPTLIFCNTRKSVMMTAETLSKELIFQFTEKQNSKFIEMASKLSEKKLQNLVLNGIGCHHAGFLHTDRNIVEQMFRDGNLPVLITTSTLAMGVNLPAHLVIIKTTQHYVNGAYTEYEESTVLQMMGRAGRPQFDTEGVAVIMTRNQDKQRYERLCGGQRSVESKLHKHLAEHLNAEVALGTIADLLLAMDWLRSTFLYVRATRNPKEYGCKELADQKSIEKRLQEICVKWMNSLAEVGLITMDDDTRVTPTEAGILMATYCLDLDTMKLILKIKGSESLSDLLNLISSCHEFEDIALRINEKKFLNEINKNSKNPTCRFPLPGKIQNKHMKANCLIQAVFGGLPIPDPSLNQESQKIIRLGENIAKCIVAYITRPIYMQTNKKIFKAVLNSVILLKCFGAKMWDNSEYVCKQFNGIGPVFATFLVSAGKKTFDALRQSNPRDLERIINRGPPAGNVLKQQAMLLPIYELEMQTKSKGIIDVHVHIKNYKDLTMNSNTTAGNKHKLSLIVGDLENNLLYFDTIMDINLLSLPNARITRTFHIKNFLSRSIQAHLISHTWVGLDVQTELNIDNTNFELNPFSYFTNPNPLNVDNINILGDHLGDNFSYLDTIKSSQENENMQNKKKLKTIKKNKSDLSIKKGTKRNKKQDEYPTPKIPKLRNSSPNVKNDTIQHTTFNQASSYSNINSIEDDNQNVYGQNRDEEWIDYESWKKMLRKQCESTPIVRKKNFSTSPKFDKNYSVVDLTIDRIENNDNIKLSQADTTNMSIDEFIDDIDSEEFLNEHVVGIFENIDNNKTAKKTDIVEDYNNQYEYNAEPVGNFENKEIIPNANGLTRIEENHFCSNKNLENDFKNETLENDQLLENSITYPTKADIENKINYENKNENIGNLDNCLSFTCYDQTFSKNTLIRETNCNNSGLKNETAQNIDISIPIFEKVHNKDFDEENTKIFIPNDVTECFTRENAKTHPMSLNEKEISVRDDDNLNSFLPILNKDKTFSEKILVDEINCNNCEVKYENKQNIKVSSPMIEKNCNKETNNESTEINILNNVSDQIVDNSNIQVQNKFKPTVSSQMITMEEISILEDDDFWNTQANPFDMIKNSCLENQKIDSDEKKVSLFKSDNSSTCEFIKGNDNLILFVKSNIENPNFYQMIKSYLTSEKVDKPIRVHQNFPKFNKKNKIVTWSDPLVLPIYDVENDEDFRSDVVESCSMIATNVSRNVDDFDTSISLDLNTSTVINGCNENHMDVSTNNNEGTENNINKNNESNGVIEYMAIDTNEDKDNELNLNENKQNDEIISEYTDQQNADSFKDNEILNKSDSVIETPYPADLKSFIKAYKCDNIELLDFKYKNILDWIRTSPFFQIEEPEDLTDDILPNESYSQGLSCDIASVLKKHEKIMMEKCVTDVNDENSQSQADSHLDEIQLTEHQDNSSQDKRKKDRQSKTKGHFSINDLFSYEDDSFISIYQDKCYDRSPLEDMRKKNEFEKRLKRFGKTYLSENLSELNICNDRPTQSEADIKKPDMKKSASTEKNILSSDWVLKNAFSRNVDDDIQEILRSPLTSKNIIENSNTPSDVFMKQFNFVLKSNKKHSELNYNDYLVNKPSFSQNFQVSKNKEGKKIDIHFNHDFLKYSNHDTKNEYNQSHNCYDFIIENLQKFECTPKQKLKTRRF